MSQPTAEQNIRQGKAPVQKPAAPPRFRARKAGPEWKHWQDLAWNCERVGLTPLQAQVALHTVITGDPEVVAEAAGLSPRQTRRLIDTVAQKLRGPEFERRKRAYFREVLETMRPVRGGEAPAPLVGLLPYVDTENQPSPAALRQVLKDARNYRNTTMRGQALTEHDIDVNGVTLLRELFGSHAAA